jgi:hypothetical protein
MNGPEVRLEERPEEITADPSSSNTPLERTPPHCWWPRTGTTTSFVQNSDGQLRVVPSDLIVRDYDCPLSLPFATQGKIATFPASVGWPSSIDPKCIVVLGPVESRFHWFVRLSMTPHVLRQVPPAVVQTTTDAMRATENFSRSSLLTRYTDCGMDLDMNHWQTELEYRAYLADMPVLLPCGHLLRFEKCQISNTWTDALCPVCRVEVDYTAAVFCAQSTL